MAFHILGNNITMAQLGHLRFWAERGRISVEDGRDNSYESMSISTFLERVNAISSALRHTKQDELKRYYRERETLVDFFERAAEVVRKAREQGSPEDPSAVRDLARRRPKSIVVPRVVDMSAFD